MLNRLHVIRGQKGKIVKIVKLDHIGIKIFSIDEGKKFWSDILGLQFVKSFHVKNFMANLGLFSAGESKIELCEPASPESIVAKDIEREGPGLHHVSFIVEDIDEAFMELKEKNIPLQWEKILIGVGGARVIFINPDATQGVIVELAEKKL